MADGQVAEQVDQEGDARCQRKLTAPRAQQRQPLGWGGFGWGGAGRGGAGRGVPLPLGDGPARSAAAENRHAARGRGAARPPRGARTWVARPWRHSITYAPAARQATVKGPR